MDHSWALTLSNVFKTASISCSPCCIRPDSGPWESFRNTVCL